jgi:hypothetical protein
MNETVAFFREFNPDLAKYAGYVVVGYLAILGIVRLAEVWRSFRTRRAILEEEKLFNEILKIKYEIEVLRKLHSLPNLVPAPADPTGVDESRTVDGQASSWAFVLRQHLRFPDLPDFTLAPLISALRLRLQRPPIGPERAIWAAKWLLAHFTVSLVVGTLVVDRISSFSAGLLGISAFVVGFYLLATLLYHSTLSVIAWVAEAIRAYRRRSDA